MPASQEPVHALLAAPSCVPDCTLPKRPKSLEQVGLCPLLTFVAWLAMGRLVQLPMHA